MLCKEAECSGKYYAKGYCSIHYNQMWRENITSPCTVAKCTRTAYTLKSGLCRGHYSRLQKGTEVNTPLTAHDSSQGCKANGCTEKHFGHGYCQLHYGRHKNGTDLYQEYEKKDGSQGCCFVDCEEKHFGKNMCLNHYYRVQRMARKKRFIEEKGNKCTDCGNQFRPECYDFDNILDEPGHVSISTLLSHKASDDRISQELKRCELVCSNCHRTRTNNRYDRLEYPVRSDRNSFRQSEPT